MPTVQSQKASRSSGIAAPASKAARNEWLWAIALIAITCLAYWPAMNAGFIWDDDDMLTNNPLMTSPNGLKAIWSGTGFYDYWPLTMTSLWLEWRVWGMNATGYHLTNILLHALASILLWRALKHLKIPGAWLAALVFAVHPLNVQSVAWITERKNTLSLFFFALALVWYLGYLNQARRKWYWLSLAAFVFALLSKTSIVMLPFVLLCCVWWLRGRIQKKDILDSLPFFAAGLAFALVTIWFQYNRSISTDVVNANSFPERLISAGMASWFYAARIIFPRNPMFVYPRWSFSGTDPINYLPGLLMLGVVFLFWLNRNRWGKPLFFGFAWFLVMLFPVLGFFDIYFQRYSMVADYWLYPSIIGVIALVVGGISYLVQRASQPELADVDARELKRNPDLHRPVTKAPLVAGAVFASVVIVSLVSSTFAQCKNYKDEETLWRATLKVNRTCSLASHNLAGIIVERCRKELGNRGLTPVIAQQLQEALTYERNAIHWKPDHAGAHYGAGYVHVLLGEIEQAVPYYKRAVELNPNQLEAVDSLAWILATHDDKSVRDGLEALRLAKHAITLAGENDPKALETLAAAQAETGDYASAEQTAGKALELATASRDEALIRDLQLLNRCFAAKRPWRSR